jgi:hypothetical protein
VDDIHIWELIKLQLEKFRAARPHLSYQPITGRQSSPYGCKWLIWPVARAKKEISDVEIELELLKNNDAIARAENCGDILKTQNCGEFLGEEFVDKLAELTDYYFKPPAPAPVVETDYNKLSIQQRQELFVKLGGKLTASQPKPQAPTSRTKVKSERIDRAAVDAARATLKELEELREFRAGVAKYIEEHGELPPDGSACQLDGGWDEDDSVVKTNANNGKQ